MSRDDLAAAGAVLAAAVVSFVFYGFVLDITRGGMLRWPPIVEGLLTGLVVIIVWQLARRRAAAATGLALAALLILLGAAGGIEYVLPFAQNPVGWAVLVALVVRLAVPQQRPTP